MRSLPNRFVTFAAFCGLAAALLAAVCAPSISHAASDAQTVPSFLKGYEDLYRQDPHKAALAWFAEARMGLMVSYSLPSLDGIHCFEQWEYKIPVREYEKKADRFTASGFNAEAIADLAQQTGMKYVTMIVKFCEGFCLWNTKQTPFNTVKTASRRDLVGEMAAACSKRGLGLFLFYEHGFEWHHPHAPRVKDWRTPLTEVPYPEPEPAYAHGDEYDLNNYVNFVHAQITELCTQYGPLAGIWLDGAAVPNSKYGDKTKFRLPELYDQIHKLQPQALVSYKWGVTGTEDFLAPEIMWVIKEIGQLGDTADISQTQGHLAKAKKEGKPVEICDTAFPGWYFTKKNKPVGADYILNHLALVRSLGANYLLNIALLSDGSIMPEAAQTLRVIGEAVRSNKLPDPRKKSPPNMDASGKTISELQIETNYTISHPGSEGLNLDKALLLKEGARTQRFKDLSFSTKSAENPFIVLTLIRPSLVKKLVIVNRKNPNTLDRAKTLTVWCSTDGKEWQEAWKADKGLERWEIDFEIPVKAKYVKIGLRETNYLHLFSVRIYGE